MRRIKRLHGTDFTFPAPESANADGVVAYGGVVTAGSLSAAYRRGIFPWPVGPRFPMLWFSPAHRFVLELDALRVSRSLRKVIRRGTFEVRFDTAFKTVMDECAVARRSGGGTWIDQRIRLGFAALHEEGPIDGVSAHSVETWQSGRLVGGLYGVAVGGVFSGESMFYRVPDASKVAFATLVGHMRERGFNLLDCQVRTEHLASAGAAEVTRDAFLRRLRAARDMDCRISP